MLRNTLSALLVSVASRYAQLSPSDVGIGIGGGRLVIDDVQLRADTFNGPHIPFHVQQGRAGRLRVNVPWGALSSSPVQVYLENVHLIAAPKQSNADTPHAIPKSPSGTTVTRDHLPHPWHQTNVGRLLFNVSVEIYGLKVEYRDDDCIGVISVASLRAFSAGPDWNMHFVSLVPDLDRDQPDATAVAMRKTVNLTGVHFVMIPRSKKRPVATPDGTTHPQHSDWETKVDTAMAHQKEEGPEAVARDELADHPRRNLDLHSFESKSPILDGVSISVRMLLCTGATVLPSQPDRLTAGLHGEVYVEIDEPTVKLTARQLVWIDHILKQGLGITQQSRNSFGRGDATKRRPRRDSASSGTGRHSDGHHAADGTVISDARRKQVDNAEESTNARGGKPSDHERNNGDFYREYASDDSGEDVVSETDDADNDYVDGRSASRDSIARTTPRRSGQRMGLRSVWEVIVGENSDETIDDAAFALGLWNDVNGDGGHHGRQTAASGSDGEALDGGHRNDDDDDDDDADEEDQQYARRAVQVAAECGGVTWEVRLRTTDMKAWERVEELEKQLAEARVQVVGSAEMARDMAEAERRALQAREATAVAERRAAELLERNSALGKELEELERLTSEASKNKDAMIRQMQGALAMSERNLQQVYQNGYVPAAHVVPEPVEPVGPVEAAAVVAAAAAELDDMDRRSTHSGTDGGEVTTQADERVEEMSSDRGKVDDLKLEKEAIAKEEEEKTVERVAQETVTEVEEERGAEQEEQHEIIDLNEEATVVQEKEDVGEEPPKVEEFPGGLAGAPKVGVEYQAQQAYSFERIEEEMGVEGLTLI